MEFLRPDGTPLPENHHLDYRPDKGDFRFKVTVNAEDPRFVGKRIFVPLHTRDVATARMMRDLIITALQRAGVLSRRVILTSEDSTKGDNSNSGAPPDHC
jgi:hypothetical protein